MTSNIRDIQNKDFDYIICGGGTAGLTVAARLSENPAVSVLVLEAGEANIGDPALLRLASYGSHFGNPAYSWDHNTTEQPLTNGISHSWARGKGLGGSSAINFMVWIKPPAEDIDAIERLGNPGWNWNNFEKYIKRTEGYVPPKDGVWLNNVPTVKAGGMGTKGPLTLAFPGTVNEGELKTFINAGIPVAPRPFNGQPHGVYFAPCTIDPKTHTRTYATTAFYLPNKDRPNLTVLVGARVNRVLRANRSTSGFIADSVEFEHSDQTYVIRAEREIILCAGALKTPQILELSGIGNPNVLRRLGIPAKVNLPGVGTNAQEHMITTISFELRDNVPYETMDCLADPEVAAKHLGLQASGTGMFASGIIGFTFASLKEISPNANAIIKAAEQKIARYADSYPPGLLEQHKISLERLKTGSGCEFISFPGMASRPNPPEKGKRYITFYVAMNHAMSRGTIHATSKDPAMDPQFDPHYLEEEVDLQVWLEMVKFARRLGTISPLKDMIAKELNPGPEVKTDGQIVDWIKQTMTTTWHTSSSCSMLPRTSGGVVDPWLRVHGTQKLRVVDLSVMPMQIAAHTQAAVYAIAEQGADIIKGEFKL